MLGLKAAVLALSLAQAVVQAPAAAPRPGSPQFLYDAAQAAYDRGDWNAAVAGFRAVLPKPSAPLARWQAIVASRLADALLHVGRLDEARTQAQRAILALPAGDKGELADAWETVGDAERFSFDYPAAADAYVRARDLAAQAGDPATALAARTGFALAQMTVDPRAAGAELDPVLADAALARTIGKGKLAQLVDLRARAALIAGDLPAAARLVEHAIDLSGGLGTSNVSAAQVAIRNDAALVYGVKRDDENTRKYLAYTGAGHQKDMGWVARYEGELPVCGEQGGVTAQDVAVVQFAIDAHGDVQGALPIYVSRTGEMGAVFARQVSTWRWDPDAVREVEPFWRATLVLQLRCQTRPTPETLGAPVYAALAQWLRTRGVDTSTQALATPAPADDARLKVDGPEAIGPLLSRYGRDGDRPGAVQRLAAVLQHNQAPTAAYAIMYEKGAEAAASHAGFLHVRGRVKADALATAVPLLTARDPKDPSVAWLRMQRALDLEDAHDFKGAAAALDDVLATPEAVLPEGAPIRRVALLHAGLAARRLGGGAEVERRIAASGLTPEQCSLFDTHPILEGHSIGSSYFPEEAMRWGFEGFVREGFDIAGDGRVANVRTLVAYPPFVFDRNSELAARTFRYLPPRIGDQSVGCTGQMQSIQYRIGS